MKIAYLFSRYPVPSQTFCDTEIRALEAAGHEVEIYSCSAPVTSFRHGGPADWPRASVWYAPPSTVLTAWAEAAQNDGTWPAATVAEHEARFGPRYDPARRARHALYFADRLRRRGIEHLHVHFANRATHAALFIQELTGMPFSFTAHAQDFLVDLGDDDLLRLLCDRAAFVVAVSDWSRRALVEKCPAAEAKIHRVYNGIDLDRWPRATGASAAPSDLPCLRILSVGRLIEFKGFQDLIAACGWLKQRGVPFTCEIAGEGPLRGALEQQTAGFNGPDALIRLAGMLSQEAIHERMERCDVFVLACRVDQNGASDVLPTVVLEAMAMAKPVVSTPIAAVPEMVDQNGTGSLVPPGDPTALADVLATLAADRAKMTRMGLAGLAKVREKFSAAESARQLSGLFASQATARQPASAKPTGFESSAEICCIFDRWPAEQHLETSPALESTDLWELQREWPGLRLLALSAGRFAGAPPGATEAPEILRRFEFLPDAVVLETDWRKHPAVAYRMESWRGEIGGGGGTEEFLLACRRALYLRNGVFSRQEKPCHLHAVGPSALWCVWLLLKLGVQGNASFLLPEHPGGGVGLAGSTLRKLAPLFSGGWMVNERKLAEQLGAGYRSGKLDSAEWITALQGWSQRRLVAARGSQQP